MRTFVSFENNAFSCNLIQSAVIYNEIWLTLPETTGQTKKSVFNVLMWGLKNNKPSSSLLLSSNMLQLTQRKLIVQTIKRGIGNFGMTQT